MTYDGTNVALFFIATVLSTPIGVFFLYIAIKKSPPSIRSYRNNLLNLMFWYYGSAIVVGLFVQPVLAFHDSMTCAKMYGLSVHAGRNAVYVSTCIGIVFIINVGAALWLSFLFRYVQIAQHSVAEWLQTATVFCVLWHSAWVIVASTITYFYFSNGISIVNDDSVMICVDLNVNLIIMVVLSVVAIYSVIISISMFSFMFLSIRALRERRHLMGNITYRLQRLLTLNLIVLTVLPLLLDLFPVVLLSSTFVLNPRSPHIALIAIIASHLPFLDVILSCCITLGFVTPYRNAVLGMFGMRRNPLLAVSIVTPNFDQTSSLSLRNVPQPQLE